MTATGKLDQAYQVEGPEEVEAFYDGWAEGYDAELAENGYVTPRRCAEALARHAEDPTEPVADFGCGTGLSGAALREAGFTVIDGFDFAEEMLERAREKGLYRNLARCDLTKPLEIEPGSYAAAAAIGVINPDYMPPTAIDEILGTLRPGGVMVFSLNDNALKDGTMVARLNDLIDTRTADLLEAEHGPHIEGTGLEATVYVLRKR